MEEKEESLRFSFFSENDFQRGKSYFSKSFSNVLSFDQFLLAEVDLSTLLRRSRLITTIVWQIPCSMKGPDRRTRSTSSCDRA